MSSCSRCQCNVFLPWSLQLLHFWTQKMELIHFGTTLFLIPIIGLLFKKWAKTPSLNLELQISMHFSHVALFVKKTHVPEMNFSLATKNGKAIPDCLCSGGRRCRVNRGRIIGWACLQPLSKKTTLGAAPPWLPSPLAPAGVPRSILQRSTRESLARVLGTCVFTCATHEGDASYGARVARGRRFLWRYSSLSLSLSFDSLSYYTAAGLYLWPTNRRCTVPPFRARCTCFPAAAIQTRRSRKNVASHSKERSYFGCSPFRREEKTRHSLELAR